ncbi:MAG: Smr/MutS family protein [Candidatus Handelsmanbacteria bacterium]|nr:Smr/MutS family protein [Candidatus Handelsmanbacteria bacterium]
MTEEGEEEELVELPIDGELDLHAFRPGEIGGLIPDYLEACRQRGILRVRIVHGKGSGALRQGVHAILTRLPQVESFRTGDAGEGGWGATVVFLKPGRCSKGRVGE